MPDEMNNNAGQPAGSGAGKVSVLPWVILLVVILAVLIGAVLFRDRIMPDKKGAEQTNESTTTETPSGYQSVFLTNGQVYFGEIDSLTDQYLTLKDIYYLQLLPSDLQGQQQQNTQQQQGQLALRKLGKSGELHGPVDVMKINREQILYYQEITEEGEVMKAIRNYQKNPNSNQQAPANSQGQQQQAPSNNSQTPANNAAPKN